MIESLHVFQSLYELQQSLQILALFASILGAAISVYFRWRTSSLRMRYEDLADKMAGGKSQLLIQIDHIRQYLRKPETMEIANKWSN